MFDITELKEKVRTAKSLVMILEMNLEAEKHDQVYLDVISVVHKILKEIHKDLEELDVTNMQ